MINIHPVGVLLQGRGRKEKQGFFSSLSCGNALWKSRFCPRICFSEKCKVQSFFCDSYFLKDAAFSLPFPKGGKLLFPVWGYKINVIRNSFVFSRLSREKNGCCSHICVCSICTFGRNDYKGGVNKNMHKLMYADCFYTEKEQ